MIILILIILSSLYFFYKAIKTNNYIHIITSLTIMVFVSQVELIQYWLTLYSICSFIVVIAKYRSIYNWKPYISFLSIIVILFLIDSNNLLNSTTFPDDIYKTKVLYFYITSVSYFSIFYFVIKSFKQFKFVLQTYFIIYFIQVSITGFVKYAGLEFLDVLFTKEEYEKSLIASIEEYLTLSFRFYDAYKNSAIELCLILFPVVFLPILKKKLYFYVFSFISIIVILLTLSRTGISSLIIFAILYAVLKNKRNIAALFVSLFFILAVVYVFVLKVNFSAIDERLTSYDNIEVRIETMSAYARNVFSINNLFGYYETSDFFFKEFKLPYAISSENFYLTILVEKGLLAGGLLIVYIIQTFIKLSRVKRIYRDNQENTIIVIYFKSVVYTSLLILFSFYYSPNDFHFWFLLVMSNILYEIGSKSKVQKLQLF